MGAHRVPGFLDPLFVETEEGLVKQLADYLDVSRQTIHRWQRGGVVSEFHKMRLNLFFIARGLAPPFPVTDKENLRHSIQKK